MMGDDGSPQPMRRATRSSILACTSNNDVKSKKGSISHKTSLDDLVHGDEPLSLEDLYSCFPGRSLQITQILSHLGSLDSPMLPLFINGGASAGKTSTILQIFRHLGRPFVYSSCLSCHSPRILFESILNQLLLHTRNEDNCYASAKRCDRPSDFANHLREGLINVLDNLKGNSRKSSLNKSATQKGNMIYLIFDNLELIREWDKCSNILPFLYGLHGTLKLFEVGIIFISKASLDSYYSNSGFVEPVPIYFPGYTEKDLRQILMQKQANPDLYSSFLDMVLKSFCRVTRRVDELSMACSSLFKIYCEPLSDVAAGFTGESKQRREDAKRRLFSHLKPHIAPFLNETFRVLSPEVEPSGDKCKGKENMKKQGRLEDSKELEFHMSTSAKYLLLSAFLASRNPATLDASLFDSTGGLDNRKRKRKSSEKNLEQKETAEQELFMKGPGTFPLERLLAVFQCIASVAEVFSADEEEYNSSLASECEDSRLMSDALLQLSSLCNANFIIKGGSCPLEGTTRYKCTVPEELALKVARSLKFPLSKYLYRR